MKRVLTKTRLKNKTNYTSLGCTQPDVDGVAQMQ